MTDSIRTVTYSVEEGKRKGRTVYYPQWDGRGPYSDTCNYKTYKGAKACAKRMAEDTAATIRKTGRTVEIKEV